MAEELLIRPQRSIIDQSLRSGMGATTTKGDGFGIGWYDEGVKPAIFKSIEPAWNDRNLREVAGYVRTPVVFRPHGHDHGVEFPFQGTIATSSGESIWAFRYSSEGKSRLLYFSTSVATLRQLHAEVEILQGLSEETRLVVSEPLGHLPGAWNEVPESAAGVSVLAPMRFALSGRSRHKNTFHFRGNVDLAAAFP